MGPKSLNKTMTTQFTNMDAIYLKENIQSAITEALTSMVVSTPEDPIEYLGNYLLNYVERKADINKVPNI